MSIKYEAVVIGTSAGGMEALSSVISQLPSDYQLTVAVVQHCNPKAGSFLSNHLDNISSIQVIEAEDKMPVSASTVFIAPAGYHLYIEDNRTFGLSLDAKENYSRPSIDVLFESAASVYRDLLVGVVLTGANSDGTKGLMRIKDYGGLCIVQDPKTAQASMMPLSAINALRVDHVLKLEEIGVFLCSLNDSDFTSANYMDGI